MLPSRPAALTRTVALTALVILSALTGAAALSLLRGWTLTAAAGVGLALWRPRWALAVLLTLLPIFGNKPGLRQVYAIVLLGSSLNIGLALRGLVSWPAPARPAGSRNPIFALLVLYGVASTLTLSTMPLTQIWYDSLAALGGSQNPVAHLALWLKATETDATYSLLSVILTWYAIAIAVFIRREITADPAATFLFARAILVGLAMTLVVGVLDFYQLIDLRPLRQLDPVVNYFGQQRLQATFGHSGWFAEYLVMSLAYIGTVLATTRAALAPSASVQPDASVARPVSAQPGSAQLASMPAASAQTASAAQSDIDAGGVRAAAVRPDVAGKLASSTLLSWLMRRGGVIVVVLLVLLAELALILTYQRGGWISHVFPLLTIWLAVFYASALERGEQRFRELVTRSLPKLALAVPLTVGVTLVIFLGVVQLGWFGTKWSLSASSYAERFSGLFDTSNRSMYLATGLKLGRLHPVLGAGSESFAFTYLSEYLRPGGAFYGHGDDPLPVLYGSAHNIYLQTLTGKGAVGLALLLAILGWVVIGGGRILLRQPDLPKPTVLVLLATIGSALGLACYGVVQEVFYIQSIQYLIFATFAIAGGAAEPWLHIRARTVRWLWVALALLFVLHLGFEYGYPGRMRERWFWQDAVREGSVLGITEIDAHGTRFRWSGARAFLDLPCAARTMTVPVRSLSGVPQHVEILVNGRMIDRVALTDHGWRDLRYSLPRSPWYTRAHCVELRVDPTWQSPGDSRQLGVMVGHYSWQ